MASKWRYLPLIVQEHIADLDDRLTTSQSDLAKKQVELEQVENALIEEQDVSSTLRHINVCCLNELLRDNFEITIGELEYLIECGKIEKENGHS